MKEKFDQQLENPKQQAPEAGVGPLGVSPPNPEREALPNVWDVLERDVRLDERYDENRLTRQEAEEYDRELNEVKRLKRQQYEKGPARSILIVDLYNTVTLEPSGLPVLILYNRSLSQEEFQQFRSKVEPLSEKEIAEAIVKAQEDFKRREEAHPGRQPPPPDSIISV